MHSKQMEPNGLGHSLCVTEMFCACVCVLYVCVSESICYSQPCVRYACECERITCVYKPFKRDGSDPLFIIID